LTPMLFIIRKPKKTITLMRLITKTPGSNHLPPA
jgi:hypothetical protein